jgi:uncharacterized membrane protein (DUF106 family)
MDIKRIRKLMDSLNDELEAASRQHDMDDILDMYQQFTAEMETVLEAAELEDDE